MKIKINQYTIDLNEDEMRKARKTSWVNGRVKFFEFTGIDPAMLNEKFAEAYDLVVGVLKEDSKYNSSL